MTPAATAPATASTPSPSIRWAASSPPATGDRARTEQTGNWTDLNGNLAISLINSVGLNATDLNILYAGSRFNGTEVFGTIATSSGGTLGSGSQDWQLLDGGDAGKVMVDPNNPNRVYHIKNVPTVPDPTNVFRPQTSVLLRSDQGGAPGT